MPAVFVTATGTDIGKTFVSAGLIRHWRETGRAVDAIKPVLSGYDPANTAASDPGLLLHALGRPVTEEEIARVSPWRFRAPLSPDLAAALEGQSIEFNSLVEFSRIRIGHPKSPNVLLIEGIGGVMVPIEGRRTVLDWMTMLRIPVILVTGSYLGTFSHTLTALHVLAQRKLDIAAIAVSETEGSTVSMEQTLESLRRFAEDIEVVAVPRLAPGASHPAFVQLAKRITG